MKVLAVMENNPACESAVGAIELLGHLVRRVDDVEQGLRILRETRMDVAVVAMGASMVSLEKMREMLALRPGLEVVVMTASEGMMIEARRLGARYSVSSSGVTEQLRIVFGELARNRRLVVQIADLEARVRALTPKMDLDSQEPAAKEAFAIALREAAGETCLLLAGEVGTGKEVLARIIHQHSPRADQPFVTFRCHDRDGLESELFGWVPGSWGKIDDAEGGTLFLEEVAELPVKIQSKLARLARSREYARVGETGTRVANVRIIASASDHLAAAVAEGSFGQELYDCLRGVTIELPSLRQRRSDVLRLARASLAFYAERMGKAITGFSPEAEGALLEYPWPGNISELHNVVERASILCEGDVVRRSDFPETIANASAAQLPTDFLGANVPLATVEEEHIRRVMSRSRTLDSAARILAIDPATLYRKRKRWTQKESRTQGQSPRLNSSGERDKSAIAPDCRV